MPIEFEHTAVELKDGSTAIWTDGLSIQTDGEHHAVYQLEKGKRYKVKLTIEEIKS